MMFRRDVLTEASGHTLSLSLSPSLSLSLPINPQVSTSKPSKVQNNCE